MKHPRAMHDLRGAASRPTRAGPLTEQKAYAALTGLAWERQRLLGQQESWQLRLSRITKRLAEIDVQVQRLRAQLPQTARGARPPLRRRSSAEIEFRY